MRRAPLLGVAAALAAGILAAPGLMYWRPALGIAAVAAGFCALAYYWWRRELPCPVLLALVFLGGILMMPPPLLADTAAQVTAVRGWYDGVIPGEPVDGLDAVITHWRLGNGPWRAVDRKLRIRLLGETVAAVLAREPEAAAGCWFEARGRLRPSAGWDHDGYVYPVRLVLTGRRAGHHLSRSLSALRAAINRVYRQYLDERAYALMVGLVFGDRDGLPREIETRFEDAGTIHLLAVSGLHVGFVVAMFLAAAGFFGWRDWRAWLVAGPAVLGYVLLCGPRPPILRAAVMSVAAGLGMIGRRKADPLNLLGLAAIVVLFVQPRSLTTVSFQLTFTACAGLILLYPRLAAWSSPRLAWLIKPLCASFAASLAVLPIQAVAFGRISLIGPAANLILIPIAALTVQAGLAAGLVGTVLPWVAGPVLAGLGLVLNCFTVVAGLFAAIPGAALNVGAWSWPGVAGYYVLLGLVSYGMQKNLFDRRPRFSGGTVVIVFAAVLTAVVWWQVLAIPAKLSVTFLDVGQGDAVLIEAPGGATALIDGGDEQAGAEVLAALRRRGINRLDLVVLTHPHSDHVGGLVEVVAEVPVGRVLDPGWAHPTDVYHDFLTALKAKEIPWQRTRRGLVFTLGRKVRGTVLYPLPQAALPENLNNGSLVMLLEFGRFVLLLPGDLEAEGEAELLAQGDDLCAAVLKVGHHGSDSSTSAEWLNAVRPRAAVISAGRSNQFGHPHAATLDRLRSAGVEVYRTDTDGEVRLITDGQRFRIEVDRASKSLSE